MNVISDKSEIALYRVQMSEMMEDQTEFRPKWLRQRNWKVAPVESGMRFSEEDIKAIVAALRSAGYSECIALATEPLDPLPCCYRMSITDEDFREFNRTCGLFRFLLTDEHQSWAISCTEWYNLFAGEEVLLVPMLQMAIDEARSVFLEFAQQLAKGDPSDVLLKTAQRYSQF
jgi:hypothetical protein